MNDKRVMLEFAIFVNINFKPVSYEVSFLEPHHNFAKTDFWTPKHMKTWRNAADDAIYIDFLLYNYIIIVYIDLA